MRVDRRSFLFGVGALFASAAIATPSKFIGDVAVGKLDSRLPRRRIGDIMISCMPTGEEFKTNFIEDPVRWTFRRDGIAIFRVMLNPRATYRWVAVPGSEISVGKDNFSVDVEPGYTHTSISLISDISNKPSIAPIFFSEAFAWEDGKCTLNSVSALDPANQHYLT